MHKKPQRPIARRGGILAKLVVSIAVVVLVVVILAIAELLAAVNATPGITTNYGQRIHDRILERQRAVHGDGPNQWPRFAEIMDLVEQGRADLDHRNETHQADPDDPFPGVSFTVVRSVPEGSYRSAPPDAATYYEQARNRAIDALDHWRDIGVFDASADLPSLHRVVMPPDEAPAVESPIDELSLSRALARALTSRMRLTSESGEADERVAAFEQGAALARIMADSGSLLGWLTAYAVEALVVDCFLQDAFLYPLDDAALAAADAAIERNLVDAYPSLADVMANERDAALDHVQRVYTATGRFIPLAHARLCFTYDIRDAPEELLPLGDSKFSNIHSRLFIDRDAATAWINEAYDLADAAANATGTDAIAADAVLNAHYTAPTWHNPAKDIGLEPKRIIEMARQRNVRIAGWRAMLAIERYRLAHEGNPPATLADLGDLLPQHLRTDPYTGQPWRYEPTSPTTGWNNRTLDAHEVAWPYTLASHALPGFETVTPKFFNHPDTGVLITMPIELPMDRR